MSLRYKVNHLPGGSSWVSAGIGKSNTHSLPPASSFFTNLRVYQEHRVPLLITVLVSMRLRTNCECGHTLGSGRFVSISSSSFFEISIVWFVCRSIPLREASGVWALDGLHPFRQELHLRVIKRDRIHPESDMVRFRHP